MIRHQSDKVAWEYYRFPRLPEVKKITLQDHSFEGRVQGKRKQAFLIDGIWVPKNEIRDLKFLDNETVRLTVSIKFYMKSFYPHPNTGGGQKPGLPADGTLGQRNTAVTPQAVKPEQKNCAAPDKGSMIGQLGSEV